MMAAWARIQRCWLLPDADSDAQSLLLNRQMRSLSRVVPWYAASNVYTVVTMLVAIWSYVPMPVLVSWIAVFAIVHIAWGWHAAYLLRRQRRLGEQSLLRRDLHVSVTLCAICGLAFGVGLVGGGPLILSEGGRLLLSCYAPGLIATGVLVGITMPPIAMTWLITLTTSTCLMVVRIDGLEQGVTLGLLCCYAVMLTLALLFASHLFVRRIECELDADRQRQIIGLLLGDFESNANDWLWESDRDGVLTRANGRMAQVLGQAGRELVGRRLDTLFSAQRLLTLGSDGAVGVQALREPMAGDKPFSDIIVEAQIGAQVRSWSLSAKPLYATSGKRIGWRGVGCDVSDARLREAEALARERHLNHLAHHDSLTGLPNRRAFVEAIESLVNERHAVALIDLDHFKTINDTLGHAAGDQVLCAVADRLQQVCRPGDSLARFGGDEFAMLLRGVPQTDIDAAISARLTKVLDVLRAPEEIHDFRVDVRASVGVSMVTTSALPAEELLRQADNALYAAKNEGRDTLRRYAPQMSERLHERLTLISDLALAVQAGELHLEFMPVHQAGDLRLQGYEALLRWRHPRHGRIAPSDFVPVAEESGLIVPIGLWVLERACRDALDWPDDLVVAVNVSPVQLAMPSWVDSVLAVIERVGLPAHRLELEVTETALTRNVAATREALLRLRQAGVGIAIDDFGVGYSSMAQLRELPFDRIKLDQSFAASLLQPGASEMTRSIIAAVVQLAHAMRLSVTAEGVETERQMQLLRSLGCSSLQGFLFGKPHPAPALLAPA